jgi:hypothetical protein
MFDQNQLGDECVKDLVLQYVWLYFIGQGKGGKDAK